MSFPDSLMIEVPTPVAVELLAVLDGCPTSAGLRLFLDHLRGDVAEARAQAPLFGGTGALG